MGAQALGIPNGDGELKDQPGRRVCGPRGIRIFDSHLHLTDSRFAEDRVQVLDRARKAGVTEMVTVASDAEDARSGVALAAKHRGLWATAGLHPHEADRWSSTLAEEIEAIAVGEEVVAVGETGLDYHYDNASRNSQRESFLAQTRLAETLGLPVVVHSREADEETAEVIREFAGRLVGVLHCFTAGNELLEAGLSAGWYVSFSGIVTFGDPQLEERVRQVPDSRLLVETDSPYLAPVPHRGRRNEPALLCHTCARVAEIRGSSIDRVAALTRRNALMLYGLSDEEERPGSRLARDSRAD